MSAENPPRLSKYLLAALVVAVVAGLVTVGVTPLGAPRQQPVGAPAAAFSAARALGELRRVAATPHPIGSQAEDEVRATIVASQLPWRNGTTSSATQASPMPSSTASYTGRRELS